MGIHLDTFVANLSDHLVNKISQECTRTRHAVPLAAKAHPLSNMQLRKWDILLNHPYIS